MVNQTMVETLTTSNSPITMTKVLFDANEIMLNDLTVLLGAAKQAGEEGLANFISERQDSHKKWQWWLKASLTQTIN
jgi:DNA-binding ferritin-like protein